MKKTKNNHIVQGVFYLLAIIFTSLIPVAVAAQAPTPSDDQVNTIARQLFCPICENTPLDVCPTQACHDWRELIRQMLAQGKAPNEIKQYFVDHYGARVLSEPPLKGLNWLAYIVPGVAFLIGVFLLTRAFRLWPGMAEQRVKPQTGGLPPKGEEDYASRLEEELRKRD